MSKIGFIQSTSFDTLFEKELDILKAAIEISEGGGIYFVEYSHKEVLSQAAFYLANEMLKQRKSIREFPLKDGLPTIEDKKEVIFIYTFIEDIKKPDPVTPSERLLKKLNAMRERIASSKENFVFWIYKDHVLSFQTIAKDLWVAKRGFYSFVLRPAQSLEPLPISKEVTSVEAAELLNQATILEEQLEDKTLSIYKSLHFEKTLLSIYERLGLSEQAKIHKTSLYKHYGKLKKLETLKEEYLNSIAKRYEWLDFKGIRQMKMIVKFRLEEIFIPPKFERQARLHESEAWEDFLDMTITEDFLFPEKTHEKQEAIAGRGYTDFMPFGSSVIPLTGTDYIMWTCTYRDGTIKRFKFAVSPARPCEFSDFLKSKKAVVLGDPGSGKSTLLKYLAYKLSTKPEEISNFKNYLPILFSVADYAISQREKELGLEKYLRQRFSDVWPLFQESTKANKALFLIDGLDEEIDSKKRIRIVRAIEEFVSKYPENRYIITSRVAGYSIAALSLGFDHFVMSAFNEEQVFKFLLNWCKAIGNGEEAKILYDTIKSSPPLFKLATNPLLLTIMALLHHQGGARLPHRRVDLYTYIIDALAETWNAVRSLSGRPIDLWLGPRRLDRHLAERILAPVAFEIHQKNPGGLIEKEYLKGKIVTYFIEYEGLNKPKAEQIAYDFIKLIEEQVGILIEKGTDRFAFTHLTFEEYLAARYLASLENVKEEVLKYLYNPHFEEVLLLTAGLLAGERAEGFVKAIYEYDGELDKILRKSLIMAARCLADEADVRFGLKKSILEDLNKTIVKKPYTELAEEIALVYGGLYRSSLRDYVEQFLYKDLLERNPESSFFVLKALKLKEAPVEVLSFIKKTVKNKNYIWLMGLNFLTTIECWTPELASIIQESLEKFPPSIQEEAIEVLKKFKNPIPKLISPLERDLEAEDIEKRLWAARLLTNLGLKNAKIIRVFQQALNKYPKQAIDHLSWIYSIPKELFPILIKIINNKDISSNFRLKITTRLFNLGLIGESEIIPIYTELLSKKKKHLWSWALYKDLSSLSPPEKAVPILKKFLKSKKHWIRLLVACSLRKLGYIASELIPMCIKGLQDKDPYIRSISINCLMAYKDTAPRVIPISVIEEALKDPDPGVKVNAAEALITLGNPPPGIGKMLYEMTKPDYPGLVRDHAYELLLRIALLRGHDRIEEAS